MQSLEEIEKEEQRVQDFYVKQYEEGKLDLIITYYQSVIERMKDKKYSLLLRVPRRVGVLE